MIDQFKAKKCLLAASTDNLVLMIIDNRPDSGAVQMVHIPGPGLEVGVKLRGLLWRRGRGGGGGWCLELTDAWR